MAQKPTQPQASAAGDGDPSMDEILASIRRILSDEEKAAKPKEPGDGVFRLDASMMVDEQAAAHVPAPSETEAEVPVDDKRFEEMMRQAMQEAVSEPEAPPPPTIEAPAPPTAEPAHVVASPAADALIAPETAAQAASSVGTLMRTLVAERGAMVSRGGPSLEDLVREEIRPLLKAWLDAHLPGTVERLVRAEIERLVGRVMG